MRIMILLLAVVSIAACTTSGGGDTVGTTTPPASTIAASTTTLAPTTSAQASTTTTTTAPATTTTAPTTTTAAATTTATTSTTSPGGPYEVGDPEVYPLAPLPGSDGAGGSGCAPGAGPLPDGVWFGYVPAKLSGAIDFDLACFYFGDIAYEKGAEDGEEVNNDYYVRNVNPTLRMISIAPEVTVHEIEMGAMGYLSVPFSDWPLDPTGYIACPSDWCGVWLFVNGTRVTEILEQYVP